MYVIKKSLTVIICISVVTVTVMVRSCNQSIPDNKRLGKYLNFIERKISRRFILTIGDSNGNDTNGWPVALRAQLKDDTILNISEGGRTIGFDNCGNPEWNVLKNIETYLKRGLQHSHQKPIDEVIILLGTNDSKACFEDRKDEVTPNLIRLITKIRSFYNSGGPPPHISIVTPPPYGPDSMVPKKALGGDYRVRLLVSQFLDAALQYHCAYVNIYHLIKPVFDSVVVDHVHLNPKGQGIVAQAIVEVLNDRKAPKPPTGVMYRDNILFWEQSISSDVIGYEIISRDRIIEAVTGNKVKLSSEIIDISVRARDGYGNVSIAVIP